MRTVAFSVWSALFARLRTIQMPLPGPDRPTVLLPSEATLQVKRDLGLLDGRGQRGREQPRQSDELREALRLPPRML